LTTITTDEPARAWRSAVRDWAILLLVALLATAARYAVYRLALNGGSFSDFVQSLCRWDCGWYQSVANGYELPPPMARNGAANWAFFPLYPLLVRAVQSVSGLDWAHAGFIVSNLTGVVAAAVARPLMRGERAYWLFAFGVVAGPFSFLFSLSYSEGLFILLTLLALRALQRSDYVAAGAWGALVSATRVTGLLIGLAILVQAIVDQLRAGTRPAALPLALLADRRLLLAGLLVPLGLIAFMLHLKLLMGDGLAFSHVQVGWGRTLANPLVNWWETFSTGWPFTDGFGVFNAHAWMAAIAVALSVALATTGRWAAAAFCLAALLVSLSAGLTSTTRFVTGFAPLGIPIAEAIARSRWATWLAYPLAFAFGLAMTAGWLLNWNLLV
jgi:hypothetical protein